VDVRILTVSKETDVKTTWWAAAHATRSCCARGCRLYEYQPTMMHAKTFIVDGAVGLDRLDELRQPLARVQQRSNFVVPRLDARRADGLDVPGRLTRSKEIMLAEFQRRPWYDR
jgi:cardiolipin synthase